MIVAEYAAIPAATVAPKRGGPPFRRLIICGIERLDRQTGQRYVSCSFRARPARSGANLSTQGRSATRAYGPMRIGSAAASVIGSNRRGIASDEAGGGSE
jgi:hypothetical protein